MAEEKGKALRYDLLDHNPRDPRNDPVRDLYEINGDFSKIEAMRLGMNHEKLIETALGRKSPGIAHAEGNGTGLIRLRFADGKEIAVKLQKEQK
jgi:hypothetical protein